MVDAYKHQSVSFTDAQGPTRYSQSYTGINSVTRPYQPYETIQTNYDILGDAIAANTYDQNGVKVAYQTSIYNGIKKITGWNDSDSGSCSNIPMPASCSSSSDTAWKVVYDADGNQLSQTDPRNQSTYANYDALDRVLCQGTTSVSVNPCQSSAYAAYFYDSYNNSSNPGLTFPSGCSAPASSFPAGYTLAETFSSSAGSGSRCNGYDARGNQILDMLSVTADGKTTTQSISMAYNNAGELKTLTYPDGEIVAYTNDDDGFFRGMTNATGSIVSSVNYTLFGGLSSMMVGGTIYKNTATAAVKLDLGYDTSQRQTSVAASISGTSIYNQTRTFDNAGNVLQVSTTVPRTTGGSKVDAQSFCYDEQNRLVWAGNTGTPTGGDHCGLSPSGTTTTTFQQPFSYDATGRLMSGASGTQSYTDPNHVHAVTLLGSIPNQYASYDDMGNLICRNTDTTIAHSCAPTVETGAQLTYDNAGRLSTWQAPSGTNSSEQYLYDPSGQRVLQRTSATTGSTTNVTDVITFDGYTDTTITNGTTTDTTKYYKAGGVCVAMTNSSGWFTLVPDVLGNTTLALNSNGSTKAVELYSAYGSVRYSDGTMPTSHNFTGQRLDSTTGLLYYNARYYDSTSGRFISADSTETNGSGQDPYAYVHGNPETSTDPTGHFTCFNPDNCSDNTLHQSPPKTTPPSSTGTSGGGGDGGSSTVCNYQLGCSGGAPSGDSDYPTGSSNLNPPCHVACAIGIGIGLTIFGLAVANFFQPETFAADPEILAAEGKEYAAALAEEAQEACGYSFTFATKVATIVGEQAIGTLKVGEKVWAYNTQTKQMEFESILRVWINHDNDLVDLTITTKTAASKSKPSKQANETVHTTKKHPFLTVEKGFLPVAQIKLGMHIVEADGRVGVVTGSKSVPGTQAMYNLEVAQDHTFTVGVGQWIVHNSNCDREQYVVDHLDELIPNHGGDESTIKIGEAQTSGYGESLPKSQPDIETPNAIIEVTGENKDGSVPDKLSLGGRGIRQLTKFVAGANGRTVYLAYEGDINQFSPALNRFLQRNNVVVVQFSTK